MKRILGISLAILPLVAILAQKPGHDQELFREVFGDQVRFDQTAVSRLKSLPPGQ
jgi:hypothetical protein